MTIVEIIDHEVSRSIRKRQRSNCDEFSFRWRLIVNEIIAFDYFEIEKKIVCFFFIEITRDDLR